MEMTRDELVRKYKHNVSISILADLNGETPAAIKRELEAAGIDVKSKRTKTALPEENKAEAAAVIITAAPQVPAIVITTLFKELDAIEEELQEHTAAVKELETRYEQIALFLKTANTAEE